MTTLDILPPELMIKIMHYCEFSDCLNIFLSCRSFSRLSHHEDFFEDLCRLYNVDLSKKSSRQSYRSYFIGTHSFFRILLLFTSFYPKNQERMIRSLSKVLGNRIRRDIHFFDVYSPPESANIRQEIYQKVEESNIILFFGGNPVRAMTKDEFGDLLHEVVTTTKKSVITLMWAHGNGREPWQLNGKWRKEKMNPIVIEGNETKIGGPMRGTTQYFKDILKKLGVKGYNGGSSYGENAKSTRKSKLCNVLIGDNAKVKKCKKIYAAERTDVKHLQLNFSLTNETVDLVSECVKYIAMRRKNIANGF